MSRVKTVQTQEKSCNRIHLIPFESRRTGLTKWMGLLFHRERQWILQAMTVAESSNVTESESGNTAKTKAQEGLCCQTFGLTADYIIVVTTYLIIRN